MAQNTPDAPEPKEDGLAALKAASEVEFSGEIKEVDFEGYKFKVDTALLDDVGIVDLIDRIETKKELKAIIDFLDYLVGHEEYEKMKAYFIKRDGRFKLTQLSKVYYVIFAQFDPKG